jgi:hypothetical protein
MAKEVKFFALECKGSYNMFNFRSLPGDLKGYCVQGIQFLPNLYV